MISLVHRRTGPSRRPGRPGRARHQLHVERLEDRTLLTAGALDPTFGDGGLARTDFLGPADQFAEALTRQADGKIVVVGWMTDAGTGSDFLVVRYNADGSLDDGGELGSTPGDRLERLVTEHLQGQQAVRWV